MPAEFSRPGAAPAATRASSAQAVAIPVTATFDQRWAAWQARGTAHDRAFRQKLVIAAPVLAIVVALVYALLIR